MKNKVSVVIVTRNRENDLRHCLGSLACQSHILDELIIVDNNSSDDTALVVKNFSKNVFFRVRYVKEKKIGYSYVYNRGLKEVKGDWIAFIDDDCIADINWYKRIKLITHRLPRLSAILGKSNEYYKKDVMALTKSYIDEVGKIGAIENKLILDHEILDSKNIIYNRNFLNKNKISFDSSLLKYAQGASEDCDLGMQIYSVGGVAIYDEKVKVAHKDPINFKSYYQKAVFTLKNHLVYEKKWEKVRGNIRTRRPLTKKISLFNNFRKKYLLGLLKTFLVFSNILGTFIYTKILRLLFKEKISKMRIEQKI